MSVAFRLKPPAERAARQRRALARLARPGGRGGLDEALEEAVRLSAETLDVESVGVWLLEGEVLVPRAFFARGAAPPPERLEEAGHAEYFRSLRESETVAAHEARLDPRTRGLAHLESRNVSSILDAPIRFAGALRGMVRHEHAGPSRWWSDDEETFAVAVAALVAAELAREELRETEERLRQLAENIQEVFWLRDLRGGRLVYVSPSFQNLWGRPPRDVVEDPELWAACLHPDDRPRLLEAAKTRVPLAGDVVEYRILRPDGEVRWIRDRAFPVKDENGEVYRVAGVAEDVTDRKRADEALRFQKSLLEAQSEAAADGILVLSPDGSVISHNRRFARLWGVPDDILKAGSERELQAFLLGRLARPKEFMARSRYLLDHPSDVSSEEIQLVDGRVFDHYSAPVRGPGRSFYGRVWFFRDVSARKRLESRLQQGQKMEAIGRLAGGIAHDFNNLLTGIIGYCDVLRGRLEGQEAALADVAEIQQAGTRAASLTAQLLAFSRKQTVQPRQLDLNEEIRNLEKMLRRLIGADVELKTELAPELGGVRADPGQLAQILMNLAVNARDAMPGGGRLTIGTRNAELDDAFVETHAGAAAGPHVVVSVKDTGTGMSKEVLAHLFEPFFTTKEQGKGTGLGLATVYGIVTQARGYVGVKSAPGQGSEFEIYLPRTGAPPKPAAPPPAPGSAPPAAGRGRILLVEDEVVVRRLVRETLKRQGFTVTDAADGEEALALAKDAPGAFDLLLTDIIMPRMGGVELSKRLRALRPGLPVLFMSGYSNDEALREGLLPPGARLITKPFAPTELVATLRQLLA